LAYLTTEYPKVSHTFIRREIQELEQRGHSVMRLAIRNSGGAIADASDQDESSKTIHCLSQPKWRVVMAASLVKSTRPLRWIRATRMAIAMSRASDRGLLRHLAYLVEAAWLLRVLQREKIEHVHVHFGTNAAAVARLVRCLGGPPYSMTVHGPNEFDSPRGFSLAEKVIDAEFVVAISDYCAAQIRRWAPHAHWHKIHVVHCTVGDEFFQPSTPISASSNSLLCVGRLSAQKGQLLLIDAMRHLIDEGLEARLVLAGDGEMRRIVEQSIAARGLQNYVSITGWVDEAKVRRLLSESRALVQPSFAEGLPVVMMEAMAMARPVIGTMIAAIPELLIHGGNGWLIPAGNIDELVSAMRDALKMSADRLNAMGLAGRERVRERHFTRTEVDKLERLFDAYVPLRDASIQRKAAGVSDATIPALEEPS
jgi:glycosyltransferase involved in cell wall biosynthesis